MPQYAITQAGEHFAQLINEVEQGNTVEITRQGQRVAMVISTEEYDRLHPSKQDASQDAEQEAPQDFWQSVLAWRKQYDVDNWDDDIDEAFDVRDKSPGREFEW